MNNYNNWKYKLQNLDQLLNKEKLSKEEIKN